MSEQLLDIMNMTSLEQQDELEIATGRAATRPPPRSLSEVEALALWAVLDHPSPLRANQELVIVLKANPGRFGGWVAQVESRAKPG